ncbi:unannotated protein [freshwater metagenome]|uniref:Unannotated protein n=1 Tax=freshwater metagenome TaxID=449393 RepID=A0A6J6SBV3_9ZZZZ
MTVPLVAAEDFTASAIAFAATHCTSRLIVNRTLVPALAAMISRCEPGISAPYPRAKEYLPAVPVIVEFILDSRPVAPIPSARTKPTRDEINCPDGYSRI